MRFIIRSKAPLRISFGGGGTEVEPYLSECGGVVLSASINKYSYGTMQMRADRQITVKSLDYKIVERYHLDEPPKYDGQLDLVKATIRRLNLENKEEGIDLFLHSDAPPGSGLGASSTLVVALIGLFREWRHLPFTAYEIADLAYQIERIDLGIQGGKQDQYAATFGGFNFIEFNRHATIVNPLRIAPDIINELLYNSLLCYTGKSRLSARIIEEQVEGYIQRRSKVVDAMDQLKEIAIRMKNALLKGQLDEFGELLHNAWENKKLMATQITDAHIDELYEAAKCAGALGGKISGAGGGGGHMFFYCRSNCRHNVAAALERLGASIVDFNFDNTGLQTWRKPVFD